MEKHTASPTLCSPEGIFSPMHREDILRHSLSRIHTREHLHPLVWSVPVAFNAEPWFPDFQSDFQRLSCSLHVFFKGKLLSEHKEEVRDFLILFLPSEVIACPVLRIPDRPVVVDAFNPRR